MICTKYKSSRTLYGYIVTDWIALPLLRAGLSDGLLSVWLRQNVELSVVVLITPRRAVSFDF